MMNLYKRGLIFGTFLSCCLSVAFLCAAMLTDHWAVAENLKRLTNPFDSDGRVFFGLFNGKRELNVGYGWRFYPISVTELMETEPGFLNSKLWIITVAAAGTGIFFSVIGALMAIVNTASTPCCDLAGSIGLFVWNTLSLLLGLTVIVSWLAQFYLHLHTNILVQEDRDNFWTSEGQAFLGYSFWFVIGSIFSHAANIILLGFVNVENSKNVKSVPNQKTIGAVLLY